MDILSLSRCDSKPGRIKALSAEDIAQLKSSTQITSLRDVVLGLLCNALDAEAHSISVHVQFNRGSCTVEDDGIGIPPSEFSEDGGLLKTYRKTKLDDADGIANNTERHV
jgi:DNA mismatch repair protein MLH3